MLFDKIEESYNFIHTLTDFLPSHGIVLGTGLGSFTQEIEVICEIPYQDIPNFPISTVKSHRGVLIFGYINQIPIVVMSGRFHYYEGYSMQQVTFPIRVMKRLGVKYVFMSNAAGSTNQHLYAGDLVFVKDHINLHPENPLRGENDERLGPRFPDMLHTYDEKLINYALQVAKNNCFRAHSGIYVGLQGPNLETPAEYRFLHYIGGDVVGMSTVPEVLVARHAGMGVFVVSVVTNQSYPTEVIKETSLEDVISTAQTAEPKVRLIVKELITFLGI